MVKQVFEDCYIDTKDNISEIGFNDDEKSMKTINNIIFFEFLVKLGDIVNRGDKLIAVESMKGTGELISKIRGEVIEVNKAVEENPELLKGDPTQSLLRIRREG
ncbi:hypothetical protein KY320_03000 [Candidatus Woesearchaeota archaeon]|nr:hypothetical protein [Candidatus Woesearchaeota archaeon]